MTQPSQHLHPKKLNLSQKAQTIIDKLKDLGANPNAFAVVLTSDGQMFGEVEELVIGGPTFIKNPKRFARYQKVSQKADGNQEVVINFMIGDMDLVESGNICVHANGGYYLGDIGESSAEAYLGLYAEFLVRKEGHMAEIRRQPAGIVTPGEARLGR
jgi:hypothetical protein